ncbi:zinc finger RNA-binding protein-like isoform X3 [Artemia franciscana]|uniref:zinc finger RNA-binding protein-like isoform X3 n=1 Tax=Artemia franciscana TaxID=6661 RepID=UPI0032DAB1A0
MSNYFGFTGNNQYVAQSTAYPTAATNYVAATAYAAAAAQPRPGYDPSSFTSTGYGNTSGFPNAYGGVTSITPSYDYSAYARAAANTAVGTAVTAASNTSAYDNAIKTHYGSYNTIQSKSQSYSTPSVTYSTSYSSTTVSANPSATYTSQTAQAAATPKPYSGYEAALYNAATSLLAQKSQEVKKTGAPITTGWTTAKKPYQGHQKPYQDRSQLQKLGYTTPRPPPKPQQLMYCDVCKISCAGPQTYKEHLDGQKHKKKEALAKAGQTAIAVPKNAAALRCELCDVACTGSDAYAAHIRGAKHQKVVKLHTRLGKPIPSDEPQLITSSGAIVPSSAVAATTGNVSTTTTTAAPTSTTSSTGAVRAAPPKISFVAGKGASTAATPAAVKDVSPTASAVKDDKVASEVANAVRILEEEKNVQPIGQEFVEEVKTDEGRVVNYHCKLCDCRFTDPNAKDMHMKGRRHRLAYKKKVDPTLSVEMKPSSRRQKAESERERRQRLKEEAMRKRREEMVANMQEDEGAMWDQFRRHEDEVNYIEYMEWCRQYGPGFRGPQMGPRMPVGMGPPPMGMMPPMGMVGMPPVFPQSYDDRHVNAKHQSLFPEEKEMEYMQKTVTMIEKALKLVSDQFTTEDEVKAKAEAAASPKTEVTEPPKTEAVAASKADKPKIEKESLPGLETEKKEGEKKDKPQASNRILKGVMRVGRLAKGLILKGNRDVRLIVFCANVPTIQLLQRLNASVQPHLKAVDPDGKYSVKSDPRTAALVITRESPEYVVSVRLTLTSPVLREGQGAEKEGTNNTSQAKTPAVNVKGALDRQSCLEALASLRHTKWFQARAVGLPFCVLVLRVLRDMSMRIPALRPLKHWALELIAEKVLFSAGAPLSPGAALRRILEAIASGFLLEGGPGLLDPCEKEPTDAAGNLTNQERLDITAYAQHALRLFAFRQVYKVLDMEQLPAPAKQKGGRGGYGNRKRRRESAGDAEETSAGKKDKRDEGAEGAVAEKATEKITI